MTHQKYTTRHGLNGTPNPSSTQDVTVTNPEKQSNTNDPEAEEYDWIPVARRRRADGWTPETQKTFIATLADCGSVSAAARAVGMSKNSCYRLRRSKDAAAFSAAWDAAIGQASRRLADVAFDRALNGVEQRVLDKEGNHIYTHYKTNDRLLMFLLRAHQPQLYGRGVERRLPIAENGDALAEAIEKLMPPLPNKPEQLLENWEKQFDDPPPSTRRSSDSE